MNAALLRKTLRDAWWLIVLACIFILGFEIFMMRMLVEAARDLAMLKVWLNRPLIQTMIQLALGDKLTGDITGNALATAGLAHPLLYAASWALLLTMATGAIAGEIGRGTADLLLTLPISRPRVYLSTSAAWALAAIPISVAPIVGLWLGEHVFPLEEPLVYGPLWRVAPNLLALNLSVAAGTMFVSALVSRRGLAVGIVLTVLLVSDLMNLLSQFWPAVRPLSVFGFLHYYRPLLIVRTNGLPWENMAVLIAVGGGAWLIGLWYFARRDIPAA